MANLNWQAQNENGDNLFPITYAENVLKPDGSAATDAVYYEDVGEQTGAAMSPILHQSDVVDNLTTTSTTAPLSAKQGKLLNDDVTSLRSDLTTFQGKFIFRYTLGIDVITTANSLPNDSITFYANSNVPTNCPSQVGYGSYIFLKTNNTTSIICFDKSHLAHTQGVTSSTTSISWHTI